MREVIDLELEHRIKMFGCNVDQVAYDLLKHTGHVYMPEGNCTDMQSTITFFTAVIPAISHIITWCDGDLDTQYVIHDGEWISI
jgi:hypothetical protein